MVKYFFFQVNSVIIFLIYYTCFLQSSGKIRLEDMRKVRSHTADCTTVQKRSFSFRGNAQSVRLSIPCLQRRLKGVNNHSFQRTANRRRLVDRNFRLSKCIYLLFAVDVRRASYGLLLHVNGIIRFPRKLKGQKIFLNWFLRIYSTILRKH